ncbi:unnamed protein product [Penicillium camemberti]|uniref:Str. FM013 n=1 Tax=Penicillium camemberti (strain FM 013) TaxID=1429867 RepID=A0A0G4PXE0_PENC3|nr:unnamed protein product [Penicillium camemberti]
MGKDMILGRKLWGWIDIRITATLGPNWQSAMLRKGQDDPSGCQSLIYAA